MSGDRSNTVLRWVLTYFLHGLTVCLIILAAFIIYEQYSRTEQSSPTTHVRSDPDRAVSRRRIEPEDFNRWVTQDAAGGTDHRHATPRRGSTLDSGQSDSFPRSIGRRLGEDLSRGLGELGVQPAEPGDQPVSFQLANLSGDTVSLADYRGQWVLLNFWATWCPPCREEMPALENLADRLPDDRFQLFTVNLGESPDTVRSFLDNQGLSLPVLLDRSGEVAGDFNVRTVPVSWVITPDGRRLGRILGTREWGGPPAAKVFQDLVNREW